LDYIWGQVLINWNEADNGIDREITFPDLAEFMFQVAGNIFCEKDEGGS